MKQALHLCLALFAMLFVGCGYDDTALRNRIEELEKNQNMKIATLSEQIEAINKTISDLKTVNANLEERIVEAEADADANAEDIAELQEAKITLEERIATLQDYVDTELRNTEDWAEATFATLQHYYVLVDDIAALNSYVDGLDDVLKQWVNKQLDGYYTIAEVNAMLKALEDAIDNVNDSLSNDIDELSEKVDEMREELISAYEEAIDNVNNSLSNDIEELTEMINGMKDELISAYDEAIEEAIKTNNGVIDGKIADAVANVNDRIESEVATINARINTIEDRIEDLENRIYDLEEALDKIKALDIEFDIESGKACMAGTSIEFGYTIVGGDEDTEVESFGDGGWRADVTAIDANSGRIRVTAPKDGGNGKVIVLATSGAGASTMKSIRFDEGVIADFSAIYHVEWEACTLMVPFKTNVDYEVRISEYAQSWLSSPGTRAEMREDVLVFSVAENTGSYMRTAVVDLVNGCGEVLQSLEIMQKQKPSSDPIQFADHYAKMVCVEKFDTNGDGELSYFEASKVTTIEPYFFGDYRNNVKSFDEFQYFVNVTTIRNYAFEYCNSLTHVTIPDSVTTIGEGAFSGCNSLTEFKGKFAEDNGRILVVNGVLIAFAPVGVSEYTIPNSVTTIGEYAFASCNNLTSITIPDGVTTIGYRTFEYCNSLTSVTIPNSVTSIGGRAFEYCNSLTSITIPDSVTKIGYRAFRDCNSLTSVTIPNSVTWIGHGAFASCDSLAEFNGKFADDNGRILVVDGAVITFAPAAGISEYTIPDSVTIIGGYAFDGCGSLTSVTIPDSVTTIGDSAFSDCNSLTSVTIPDSVTTIESWAFWSCSSLTQVTIPDSVTTIAANVFVSCMKLKDIYCKATTPPTLGIFVFENNASDRKIYVPMESVEAYMSAESWSYYADAIVGYNF